MTDDMDDAPYAKAMLEAERAYAAEEVKRRVAAAAVEAIARRNRLVASIGKRYEGASLDSIVPASLRELVSEAAAGKCSLYLHGPVGTGKTWALAALLLAADGAALYGPVPHLLGAIRQRMDLGEQGRERRNTADRLIADYCGSEIAILDDLGAENPSAWSRETLYRIIDARYVDDRPIVVASNYSLDAIAPRIGERSAERLGEMCRVVPLLGASRRVRP